MELMKASHQWKNRPDDERYLDLPSLYAKCKTMRENSEQRTLHPSKLEFRPVETDMEEFSPDAMSVVMPDGVKAGMTHYAFGQLCRWADSPADFLRRLPSDIAADALADRLAHERNKDIGILLQSTPMGTVMRCATGANYGRVWNDKVVEAIMQHFGDGVHGDFRVPGVFGQQVEITKANTTIYGGERDMFIFLADERNRIEIPNRRNGKPGLASRGVFFWNSEVGAESLGVATFLFDYVCGNRIVWGATEYKEFRIRHSKYAPLRFMRDVAPAISAYANSSTAGLVKTIERAQHKPFDPEKELARNDRFTRNQAKAIQAVHIMEEERPIETVWDASVAITAYARSIGTQTDRVDVERIAGRILEAA